MIEQHEPYYKPVSYDILNPWKIDPGFNIPYGILTPGSNFRHCIFIHIMVNLNPLIPTKREGSIYHW